MFAAFRDVTLFQAGFDSLRQGLAALGLARVEVALTRNLCLPALEDSLHRSLSAASLPQAQQAASAYRSAGVEPCVLFVVNNFNGPDPQAEIAHVTRAVEVAQAMSVPIVRLDGAMSGPDRLPRRRRVALYVRAMEQVLQATPAAHVVLAIENHGRQGNDSHWLQEVLAALPPGRVGLALDPANLYWAGYPLSQVYDLIADFAPRVLHVHTKNLTYPPAMRERRRPAGWEYGSCVCPLPEGDLDYARVARLLAASGYQGALAIEDESLAKYPPPERPALLQWALRYLCSSLPAPDETAGVEKSSNH